jgi:hypothetical protein
VTARNTVAADDYSGSIARLLADARIETLLVDHGYPANPELSFAPFARLVPAPGYAGSRIERFFPAGSFRGAADEAPTRSFDAMLEAFEARLDQAVAEGHRIFLKTTIASCTGLAIAPVDREMAAGAWRAHRAYGDAAEKVICDYLFVVTAAKARMGFRCKCTPAIRRMSMCGRTSIRSCSRGPSIPASLMAPRLCWCMEATPSAPRPGTSRRSTSICRR